MRILKTTFINIKSNKQLFFASVGTIATALSILGLFLFVYINLNSVLSFWNDQVQLIVYLDDEISSDKKKQLEKLFSSNPEVDVFDFVSREKAWENFQSMFSEKSSFLKGMGFNPLPASYNLMIKPSPERLKYIQSLANKLNQQDGVESVEYGEEWINRFETFMILMQVFLLALGALLCLGSVLIISNTVKLSVLSRKSEIELMLLTGATPGFIKFPFFLEGVFHGLLGAVVSLSLIKGLHLYLVNRFQGSIETFGRGMDFQFISMPFIVIIVLSSILVGWLGSYLSLQQFLR
ncbi:MAG: permease-like cell division protein FtsX, partial [Nitrospinaceae bacterium]